MSGSEPGRPVVVIPGDQPTKIADSPHLERLRVVAEVILYPDRPADTAELIRRVEPATAAINSRGGVRWPAEVFEASPRLRYLTACGVGTDTIDLPAARRAGVVVSNVPGRTAGVVAEHALALLMAAARRIGSQAHKMRRGRWEHELGMTLDGKTLGLIGTGPIGARMAHLARGIGMKVQAWTFHPTPERAEELGVRFLELDELLATSDCLSVHVRLSPESHGLLNARRFALMKPGAILVNTARGAVIETESMLDALRTGQLSAAGLDVFEQEPLPADHPLLQLDNVVLTPHSADQTPEGRDLLNGGAVDNVLAFLDGRPQHIVHGLVS